MNRFLIWLPRILAISFIGSISLFALDVFDEGNAFGTQLRYFFLHLIPSFTLIICLWIAWNNRLFGGLLFMLMALMFTVYFGTFREWTSFLLISAPPAIIGILFMISRWNVLDN